MDYTAHFTQRIDQLKTEGRYRYFAELERPAGQFPRAKWYGANGSNTVREVVVWCANDYLGMGHHPALSSAMQQAIAAGATGAGGTRNIAGTHHAHVELERLLANLHGKERALTFTSGYVANLAALSALGNLLPECVILSDAANHNSMIEGIRRSNADKIVFRHNDVVDLERNLRSIPLDRPKIVAFESVYSMSGAIAPIEEICALAKRYNALTYLDEVHAVGMYGERGGGIAQEQGVEDQVDVIQGTLGKAYGLVGGYITGNNAVVDCVRSFGHAFIFSTALPPLIARGAIASVSHLMSSDAERKAQRANVTKLKSALRKANIPALANSSHIVPVMVGDAVQVKRLSDALLERFNIYVQPINYPTVARGAERLRITPGPMHTAQMMDELVHALVTLWDDFKLPREWTAEITAQEAG